MLMNTLLFKEAMLTYQDDNIFAKILRGELPAYKVYEDEHSLAFMDIMPQTPGHTLVISKTPAENLFDISAEALAYTIATTQKVAKAVKKATKAGGIMIAQLNDATAGQTVFHLHFHILPRYDGIDLNMHARQGADQRELAEWAGRISAAL